MAPATPAYSRFHNLSDEALADAIGQADVLLKGAEAECIRLWHIRDALRCNFLHADAAWHKNRLN
jgi:hypothetical protein